MIVKKKKPAGTLPKNMVFASWCRLEDFDALDRDKTLFILPVSSLEVHGHHLPNDTDMTSSVVMAEQTGVLFARAHRDWKVVQMPLLNIGTDELPLPGSIEFSRKTVYRALKEYAWSLARFGFTNLVITNGHGGLKHNLALDDACRTCNRRYRMKMISPGVRVFQEFIFGKKFPLIEAELGRDLTEREKEGLIDLEHAGGWETSIVLAENNSLVSRDYKKYTSSMIRLSDSIKKWSRFLEPVIHTLPILRQVMKALALPLEEGLRILATANRLYDQKKERFTYSGDPSVARADIGKAWITAQAKEMLRLIEMVYCTGEMRPSEVVSNYSVILVIRRDFMVAAVSLLLAAAAAWAVAVFLYKCGVLR